MTYLLGHLNLFKILPLKKKIALFENKALTRLIRNKILPECCIILFWILQNVGAAIWGNLYKLIFLNDKVAK